MMTTQEFVKDKTPRAGFWRVRAKVKTDLSTEIIQEIVAVAPPPSQSRDGAFSSLPPAVPASHIHTDASAETQRPLKPVAATARRVTAPVSAPSKTADTGAIVVPVEMKAPSPKPVIARNWITNRFEQLADAIAFLKTLNIGVEVVDRAAMIKKYRVSSLGFQTFFHEEVLEIAISLGWNDKNQKSSSETGESWGA